MDPLSVVTASLSIAGGIAKASVAIFEFSRAAKDAAEDLNRVNCELQALSSVLDPLARGLSASPATLGKLAEQLRDSLEGCSLVVVQITDLVEKFRRESAWTRTKWVVVGRGDMEKLRESLEAYKMALSLGLHAVSMSIQEDIKEDTGAVRSDQRAIQKEVAGIKVDTEEILARVNSIRHGRRRPSGARVEQWVEEIEVLTSYAETSYQETVSDPHEDPSASDHHEKDSQSMQTVSQSGSCDCDDLGTAASDHVITTKPSREGEESGQMISGTGVIRGPSMQESMEKLSRGSADEIPPIPISTARAPELVVAIDIGELSTAVSWMAKDAVVHSIREWPGGIGPRVPTSVSPQWQGSGPTCPAPPEWPGSRLSWGFQCAWSEIIQRLSLTEFLELGADKGKVREHRGELRAAWVYFLFSLYSHIRESVSKELRMDRQAWAATAVEFHFSLPDMMLLKPHWAALAELKEIIRDAGIGTEAGHCAILGLAEIEAVATAVLGESGSVGLKTLLVKVGEGTVSILELSWEGQLYSGSRTPYDIDVLPGAVDDKELLTRDIQPRLRNISSIAIVATGPTAQPCADALRSALGPNTPHVLPASEAYTAAVEGLLVRRQAWGVTERPLPLFRDSNIPCIFIRLSEPSNNLDVSKLMYNMTNNIVRFEVETVRPERPNLTQLQFDIFFTFDTRRAPGRVSTKAGEVPSGLTRLCSIRSLIEGGSFEATPVKDKWYMSSRTTYIVRFSLRLLAMEPSKLGPQFQLFVRDGAAHEETQRKTEVTWHAEPPQTIWPPGVVVKQAGSRQAPPTVAGDCPPPIPPRKQRVQEALTGSVE